MINLQDNIMGGPQGSPVTPQQPVRNVDLSGIGNLFTMVERHDAQARINAELQRELKEEADQNSAVKSYYEGAEKIALGRRQGKISEQEAWTQLDKVRNSVLAKFPDQAQFVLDFQNKFLDMEGLGTFVKSGNEQEQLRDTLVEDLTKKGIIGVDDSEQQKDAKIQQWQAQEAELRSLELKTKRLALREQDADTDMAELSRDKAILEDEYRKAILKTGDNYLNRMRNKSTEIMAALKETSDPQMQSQLLGELESLRSEAEQAIRDSAGTLGEGSTTQALASVKDVYDTTLKFVNGDIERGVYETRINNTNAKNQFMVLQDPTAALGKAFYDIYGELASTIQADIMTDIGRAYQRLADGIIDIPSKPDKQENILSIPREGMNRSNLGELTDEQEASTKTLVEASLEGIASMRIKTGKPQDIRPVMKYIASDEVGTYMMEKNGMISVDAVQGATELLERQYFNQVLPVIQEASGYDVNTSQGRFKLWQVADLEITNGTVRVVPKEGVQEKIGSYLIGNDMSSRIAEANKIVSPILTQMVKAKAHLSGNKEYGTQLDVLKERILGDQQQAESVEKEVVTAKEDEKFVNTLKEVENDRQVGKEGLYWKPHESVEGGTKTIGYGHKLEPEEAKGNYVMLGGEQVSLEQGLTDEQVEQLLMQDIDIAEAELARNIKDYYTFPAKYRRMLVNIQFNTGKVNEDTWPKLLEAIRTREENGEFLTDLTVFEQSLTSYNDGKNKLVSRRNKMAMALMGI